MKMQADKKSPLVETALALNSYLSELERLSAKLDSMEMKSEFEIEHSRKLMAGFAENANGVANELTNISSHLEGFREQVEKIVQTVSVRAAQLRSIQDVQEQRLQEFQLLSSQVHELNTTLSELKPKEGEELTEEARNRLAVSLAQSELQIDALAEQAQNLRNSARESYMRSLEKNADSLAQTLQFIRKKLTSLNLNAPYEQAVH